jgi:hypothetical protein
MRVEVGFWSFRAPANTLELNIVPNGGRVAQLGEHLLCKQGVAGSNPVTSTNLIPAPLITYPAICTALLWCNFGTIGTTEALLEAGSANAYV